MATTSPPGPPEKAKASVEAEAVAKRDQEFGLHGQRTAPRPLCQEADHLPTVVIGARGICIPNPGPAAWVAVLKQGNKVRRIEGKLEPTSSNVAELIAVIEAFGSLKRPCRVIMQTESRFVRDGACVWLAAWAKHGWAVVNGRPSPSRELWQRLAAAIEPHNVTWKLLRTRAGHPLNELADAVCSELVRRGRTAA